jgi:hypothetical protein
MARLPDIEINEYTEWVATKFRESTDGLFPSLEFSLGARDAESQIPPDYDAPGGMDQWEEAERKTLEEQYRQQQLEEEERKRQEREQLEAQYRQMQAESEAQAQSQAQALEANVMDEIRGRGIPTPSEAFSSLSLGDNTSSALPSNALPPMPYARNGPASSAPMPEAAPPPDDADQFNSYAQGLSSEVFGPAPPPEEPPPADNESSTGVFDRIGSRISELAQDPIGVTRERVIEPQIEAVRQGVEGVGYVMENYGIGRVHKDFNRQEELEDRAYADRPFVDRIQATLNREPSPNLTPEENAELEELQRGRADLVAGVTNPNPGGMSDEGVRAIQALIKQGIPDDMIVAMERHLADNADVALSAIQKLTRGAADVAPVADDAAGGVMRAADDVVPQRGPDLPTPAEELPDAVRITPADEAANPGYSDYKRESIRGYGRVPQGEDDLSRGGEQIIRDEMRGNRVTKTFTEDELVKTVAAMTRVEPEIAERVLRQAMNIVPEQVGAEQRILREATTTWAEAYRESLELLAKAQDDIADFKARHPGSTISNELHVEAELRMANVAEMKAAFELAAKPQSLSARAHSYGLLAQKKGRLGDYELEEIQRMEAAIDPAKLATGVARKLQLGEAVSEKDIQDSFGAFLRQLDNKKTREALVGKGRGKREVDKLLGEGADDAANGAGAATGTAGRGAAGAGRAAGAGAAGPPAPPAGATPGPPKPPKDETLAERLGRLEREREWLRGKGNDSPAALSANTFEYEAALREAEEHAVAAAKRRIEFTGRRTPPTPAEEEKILNEALGRRALGNITREELARQKAAMPPTEVDIRAAMRRQAKDAEKLQKSIDVQVQRRVDGMLATEKRAEVRAEIKDMAKEAQTWAARIRKMPEQEGLREEFDLVLRKMREHSNHGERVAADLAERLGVRLDEDVVNRMFREAKQGTDALNDARIRAVQAQIKEAMSLSHAPDRNARLAELYQDMADISIKGAQRVSAQRKRLYLSGIEKVDYDPTKTSKEELTNMMLNLNVNDPDQLRMFAELVNRPDIWNVAKEMSFINMLSNPMTFLTNVKSTALNGLGRVMIQNPLEYVGSGGHTKGQIAAMEGLFSRKAGKEGYGKFKEIMRTGINKDRFEKSLATGELGHIGGEKLPIYLERIGDKTGWNPLMERIGDKTGLNPLMQKAGIDKFANLGKLGVLYHQVSTRPLEASDAWMSHMMYASATKQLAQQKADDLIKKASPDLSFMKIDGSTAPQREQAAQYIMEHIWDFPEVIKGAGKISDHTLFRSRDISTNEAFANIEQALRMAVGTKEIGLRGGMGEKAVSWIVDFIIPFWNVPWNFTKQGTALIASPARFLQLPGDYAKGNYQEAGEHFAKAMQGSALAVTAFTMAANDMLTGPGPRDKGDRDVWLLTHRPHSFRIPLTDQWISYAGTPLAIPLSAMAGAFEEVRYTKDESTISELGWWTTRGAGAASGFVHGAMSNSLLDAATRNFEFLTGQTVGENALSQTVAGALARYGSPVPAGMITFLASQIDVMERDVGRPRNADEVPENVWNRIKMRVPGLRETLPVATDAYGEERPNVRSVRVSGPAALDPAYRGSPGYADDAITGALQRASVGAPQAQKEITRPVGIIPITIREQQQIQAKAGQYFREALENVDVGNETYSEKYVLSQRERARERAENEVLNALSDEEFSRRLRKRPYREVGP